MFGKKLTSPVHNNTETVIETSDINNKYFKSSIPSSSSSFSPSTVQGKRKTGENESFCSRLRNDICDRELLPLKILFFVKAGTVFVLYPYLNLHLKSLGLEVESAGISNALTIFTIFGQPLAGIISDKIGNFKVFLTVITLLTPIFSLLILTVPIASETVMLPKNLTFSFDCSSATSLKSLNPPELCIVNTMSRIENQIYSKGIIQCGQVCPITEGQIDKSHIYSSSFPQQKMGAGTTFYNEILKSNVMFTTDAEELDEMEFNCNSITNGNNTNTNTNVTENTKIKNLDNIESCYLLMKKSGSKSSWKFRTTSLFHNNHNLSLNLNSTNFFSTTNSDDELYSYMSSHNTMESTNNISTYLSGEEDLKAHDLCIRDEWNRELRNAQHFQMVLSRAENCSFQCFIFIPTALVCTNDRNLKTYNEELTFWLYNVLRVCLVFFSSTCWIMFEGAVLAIIKERDGDYGVQRASSFIAAVVAAPLSGFIISYFDDFRPAFYLYTVLQVFSAILTMKINLTFKKPAEQIWSSLYKLLKQAQVLGLLFFVLISGIAWGYLESFLFWYLQELGGDGLLMGLTITVGGLAGLPFLILSKPIIDKLGHVNVISLGLVFYGVRLVGYSFIINPWCALPFEALEAFTSSLAITAANTYASYLSCENTVVSLQGIIGALYYSVGRAIGSLIGGYLIKFYGDRSTYQILAGFSFGAGVLYFVLNLAHTAYIKHKKVKHEMRKVSKSTEECLANKRDNDVIKILHFDGGYLGPLEQTISKEQSVIL